VTGDRVDRDRAMTLGCCETILVEISASHGGDYEDTALWGIVPCSLVEVDLLFRGVYCLHHRPDNGGGMHLRNILR
jgi:hypothetical protein